MNTHLTVTSTSSSVGACDVAPGYYPETELMAEHVVVSGAHETAADVRTAWRAQMGTSCPV